MKYFLLAGFLMSPPAFASKIIQDGNGQQIYGDDGSVVIQNSRGQTIIGKSEEYAITGVGNRIITNSTDSNSEIFINGRKIVIDKNGDISIDGKKCDQVHD